jgi:hypothetical protein
MREHTLLPPATQAALKATARQGQPESIERKRAISHATERAQQAHPGAIRTDADEMPQHGPCTGDAA